MVTEEMWDSWAEQCAELSIALGLPEERVDRLMAEVAEAVHEAALDDPNVLRQLALGLAAAAQLKLALDEAQCILTMLREELGPPAEVD